MSDSNRSSGNAFLRSDVFAISIMVAYLLIGFLAYQSGGQNERRTYQPHQHAISAADSAKRTCVTGTPSAVAECIVEKVAAAEETARSEQDLEAQQDMARWALIMVLVSAITLGVTIWALFYVKGTLDETRRMSWFTALMANEAGKATTAATKAANAAIKSNKIAQKSHRDARKANKATMSAALAADEANKIARETSVLQTRPIMVFADCAFYPSGGGSNIRVVWKNSGIVPADIQSIQLEHKIVTVKNGQLPDASQLPEADFGIATSPNMSVVASGMTLSSQEISLPARATKRMIDQEIGVLLVCRIEYKSFVTGEDVLRSEVSLVVGVDVATMSDGTTQPRASPHFIGPRNTVT